MRTASGRHTVIDSVVDPLTDDNVKVGEKVTLIRHSGKPMGGSEFHLVITEPHVDSFAGARLELEFSGIPEDVELVALDAWLTTKKDFENDETKTAVRSKQIPIGRKGSKTATAEDDDTVIVYLVENEFAAEAASVEVDEDNDPVTPARCRRCRW